MIGYRLRSEPSHLLEGLIDRRGFSSGTAQVSLRAWSILLTVCLGSGCWGGAPPGRVTTTGVVLVAGDPLPEGEIAFESVEEGLDVGVSRIDRSGEFSLFLKPGTYRVAVESVEGGVTPAGLDAVEPQKLRVPKRYANPQTSGLEYTIDASNRRLIIDIPK